MQIDPRVEERTRELLGFALRAEFKDFERVLTNMPDDDTLRNALGLAAAISAYVVVDDNAGREPSNDDLREVANTAAEVEDRYVIDADKTYEYLRRCVFGTETVTEVLSTTDAVNLPFVVAANLIGSTTDTDNGQKWPERLDEIEAAIEAVSA